MFFSILDIHVVATFWLFGPFIDYSIWIESVIIVQTTGTGQIFWRKIKLKKLSKERTNDEKKTIFLKINKKSWATASCQAWEKVWEVESLGGGREIIPNFAWGGVW